MSIGEPVGDVVGADIFDSGMSMDRLVLALLPIQLIVREEPVTMTRATRKPRSTHPTRIGIQTRYAKHLRHLLSNKTHDIHFFIKLFRLYTSSIYIRHYTNKQTQQLPIVSSPPSQGNPKRKTKKSETRSLASKHPGKGGIISSQSTSSTTCS